ncbi:hypothetical protein [Paraburkholderia atlantica]|uniref:hypothetical protein n=1 Tax=Paraburkholderia atlantica TaxID=2654982 RepID=UPI0001BF4057|nr:hypothetical protein [Paraburkholderia atlantica]
MPLIASSALMIRLSEREADLGEVGGLAVQPSQCGFGVGSRIERSVNALGVSWLNVG